MRDWNDTLERRCNALRPKVFLALVASLIAGCTSSVYTDVTAPASRATLPKGTTTQAYLYLGITQGLRVYTYPDLVRVRVLTDDESYPRVCSDPKTGHMFLSQTHELDEYDAGASTLIQTLAAPSGYGALTGCSIDPISGNVAVVAGQTKGGLLIYEKGTTEPNIYSDPTIAVYFYCSYDDRGDVFVIGYGIGSRSTFPVFAELRKGATKFRDLHLDQNIRYAQKLQWDGTYMTLNEGNLLYRVAVKGTNATVVGTTVLQGDDVGQGGIAWILGDSVIDGHGSLYARHIGVWPYPAGGEPLHRTRQLEKRRIPVSDINVSEAPTERLQGTIEAPSEK